MTWAKYGTEFFDQLAEFDFPTDLDDACQLVHTQALHYLYSTEEIEASFLKKNLKRIVSSPKAEQAAEALVKAGAWEGVGNRYRVRHHEEIFRQSLGYQVGQRERDRNRKRKERSTKKDADSGSTTDGHVTGDVTGDVLEVQTDSQTDKHSSYDEVDTSTGEVVDEHPSSPENPFPSSEDPFPSGVGSDGWPLKLGASSVGGGSNGSGDQIPEQWKNRA